jgi:hypothetical protein
MLKSKEYHQVTNELIAKGCVWRNEDTIDLTPLTLKEVVGVLNGHGFQASKVRRNRYSLTSNPTQSFLLYPVGGFLSVLSL